MGDAGVSVTGPGSVSAAGLRGMGWPGRDSRAAYTSAAVMIDVSRATLRVDFINAFGPAHPPQPGGGYRTRTCHTQPSGARFSASARPGTGIATAFTET